MRKIKYSFVISSSNIIELQKKKKFNLFLINVYLKKSSPCKIFTKTDGVALTFFLKC